MEQDEKNIKPVGMPSEHLAGSVRNEGDSGLGYAVLWNNGIATFHSDDVRSSMHGKEHDGIFVPGHAEHGQFDDPNRTYYERIYGDKGHDAVILPGQQEDYIAHVPSPEHYPAVRASVWDEQEDLYGHSLVLENISTEPHQFYIIHGVETVAFDNGHVFRGPRDVASSFHDRIKDGTMTSVSTQQLFRTAEAELSTEEKLDAKIYSTKAFGQRYYDEYKLGSTGEDIKALEDEILGSIKPGFDPETVSQWKPDPPQLEVTANTFGIELKP